MSKSFSDGNFQCKTMTLTGQGQVSQVADTVIINLGVQTTGYNLVAIQSENAQKTQAILQALKHMGITDVKTIQYSVDKIYDYENGKQIDKGYSVRNILEIKTKNINSAGNVIDSAVNMGANVVDLISFDVSNKDFYYLQALNLAVQNASQKAKSISMNLGLKTNPTPSRITENSTLPSQPFRKEFAASTPIVPGNLIIEALVTIEFIY